MLKEFLHKRSVDVGKLAFKLMQVPIPVTFAGSGSSAELAEAIGDIEVKKLLIVTDEGLVQVGIVGKITDLLDAAGVPWALYTGVLPDPTYTEVNACIDTYRAQGCDSMLALGGGSPIDVAKVAAASVSNGKPAEELEGRFKLRKQMIPLFAIPTTAGTGSEVSAGAVVGEADSHKKKFLLDLKVVPLMIALDPDLMLGLPPAITAATGMDALTHAVESYLAKTASPESKRYAAISLRLIFKHLPVAVHDGKQIVARKGMLFAAYYAGLAFTRTSLGYVHAMAHAMGVKYGIPHGVANAAALPVVLDASRDDSIDQLAEMAEIIGIKTGTKESKADAFIAAVRALKADIGMEPTVPALLAADIPALAVEACAEVHMNYPVPTLLTQEEVEAGYRTLLSS
ncbi:MAG: iron-containing alcohol dehydrogenase [Actinobacteria bacterium]|nr:iron-containing alcohol dehydrogenase [Actinomycetota bacterium]MCB9389978.1 iron-containing alcohol dehydrogenase [Acidimicrobiia bacterium]